MHYAPGEPELKNSYTPSTTMSIATAQPQTYATVAVARSPVTGPSASFCVMSPKLWKSGVSWWTHREWLTEDVRVHHDLPRVHWEVCVVERPVKHLGSDRLVGWVVVRREVLVCQAVGGRDTGTRVEDEHLLEQVERDGVGVRELGRERHLLALRQALDESESLELGDTHL